MADQRNARAQGSDSWLGLPYVAEQLGVSEYRVRQMIEQRMLEAHRIGRVVRIRKSELERYLRHWGTACARAAR